MIAFHAPDPEMFRLLVRSDRTLIERFMVESNAIEGESGLNPGDIDSVITFLAGPIKEATVLKLHAGLGEHLGVDWTGKYRDCNVRVGECVFPPHEDVPALMKSFFRALSRLGSWEAHNRFVDIHPFRDLNGRVGRAIWLHKALGEGFLGQRAFLHEYYYQTLRHQPDRPRKPRPN
jgi:Fic family protein